jgi:hypothetical protein
MSDENNMNMMMGWGTDTALAPFRIFRSGILERHPDLKIITHNLGWIGDFKDKTTLTCHHRKKVK